MKYLFLVVISLFISKAFASMGINYPSNKIPHAVCKITYKLQDGRIGVCSSTYIGKKKFLTAKHCDEIRSKYNITSTFIECGEQKYKYKTINSSSYDAVILKSRTRVDIKAIKLNNSYSDIIDLTEQTDTCIVAGYGMQGVRPDPSSNPKTYFTSPTIKAGELNASIAFFKEIHQYMYLQFITATNQYRSTILTPGDSGGPVLCKNKKNQWVQIAMMIESGGRGAIFSSFISTTMNLH